MAETAYEHECNRAELLGLGKPDFQEFLKNFQDKKAVEEEQLETEILKEAEVENEALKGVSGGLEELGGILRKTQKHINNFKVTSITNYLKDKLVRRGSTSSTNSVASDLAEEKTNPENENLNAEHESFGPEVKEEQIENIQRKSDLSKALDNNVDKLDGLIQKAEKCQISLNEQTKQMKSYIRK